MSHKVGARVGLAVIVSVLAFVGAWHTQAGSAVAITTPASGITVSPASVNLNLAQASQSQEGVITVRNDYSKEVSFNASVRGMQVLVDGSLAPSDNPDSALESTLSLTPTSFTLGPGQTIDVRLRLVDSSKLSPGGHYASVLIKQISPGAQRLSLSPAVSVAVFVVKEDGAIWATEVKGVSTNGRLFKMPTEVLVDFSGAGNVSVVPRATVSAYDPRGRLVATGVMNDDSIPVRPGRVLKLQSRLRSVGLSWAPGRYTIEVRYRHDGSDVQKVVAVSKWLIPPVCIYGLIAVVILGVGLFKLVASGRAKSFLGRRTNKRSKGNHVLHAGKVMDLTSGSHRHKGRGVEKAKPRKIDVKLD